MNFHHTDPKKMIELMEQVERDLLRAVPECLAEAARSWSTGCNVKQYLDGEFQVRQDATANLPTDIQKEILGSMHDPLATRLGGAEPDSISSGSPPAASSR
jgi:hypothetical protein